MQEPKENIKVVIVDDHQLVLDGIKIMLNQAEGFECVACFDNGKEAIEFLKSNEVNIILQDVEMPELNGIEICKIVKRNNKKQSIIALTMLVQHSVIEAMVEAGADGFLIKNSSATELLFAIKEVYEGRSYYSSEVLKIIESGQTIAGSNTRIPKLSRREKEIIKLILAEKKTHEIAEMLFISPGTVETHRRNIMNKLGTKNSAGMVKVVIENRLL